jgi:hypothetical protein
MELLKIEKSVNRNVRKLGSEIQLELLKLHKPPPRPAPPPKRRRWLWRAIEILNLFSVRGSIDLYREVGPGFRPERVERKEGRPRFF